MRRYDVIPANGYAIIGNETMRASVPLRDNGKEFKIIVDPRCPPDLIYYSDNSVPLKPDGSAQPK